MCMPKISLILSSIFDMLRKQSLIQNYHLPLKLENQFALPEKTESLRLKNSKTDTKELREEDLVRRVRDGDPKAEKLIFDHFNGKIDTMLRQALGYHNEDWRDVAIVIKAAVLSTIRGGSYKTENEGGAPLHKWVVQITRNQIHKYLRDRRPHAVDIEEVAESISTVTDEAEFERNQLVNIIREILKQLHEKYRNVLQLRYFDGMSPQEISEQLSIPVAKVYELTNYGIRLVKKKCEQKGIFQDF